MKTSRKGYTYTTWTPDEDEIIQKYYAELGSLCIAEIHLQSRTPASIRMRASKLGIHRPGYLRYDYSNRSKPGPTMVQEEPSEELGLRSSSLPTRVKKLIGTGISAIQSPGIRPRQKKDPGVDINLYAGLPFIKWPVKQSGCGHIMRICQDTKKDPLLTQEARDFFLSLATCMNTLSAKMAENKVGYEH